MSVAGVPRKGAEEGETGTEGLQAVATFGTVLSIQVENLEDLDHRADLVLVLDGIPLSRIAAVPTGMPGELRAHLGYDVADWKAWEALIRAKEQRRAGLRVSVAPRSGPPIAVASRPQTSIQLEIVSPFRFAIWLLAMAAGLATIVAIGRKTPLARDPVASGDPTLAADRPYSLSRVQLLFWLLVSAGSYLYVWFVLGQPAVLTGQGAGLLTISTLTLGGARAAELRRSRHLHDSEKQKRLQLASAIRELQLAPLGSAERYAWQREARDLRGALRNLERRHVSPRSRGLVTDLIATENGADLHRVQLVVWSLLIALGYVFTVAMTLTMPELSPETLAFLGISGTTYVGFKLPEGPKADRAAERHTAGTAAAPGSPTAKLTRELASRVQSAAANETFDVVVRLDAAHSSEHITDDPDHALSPAQRALRDVLAPHGLDLARSTDLEPSPAAAVAVGDDSVHVRADRELLRRLADHPAVSSIDLQTPRALNDELA